MNNKVFYVSTYLIYVNYCEKHIFLNRRNSHIFKSFAFDINGNYLLF